MTPEHVARLHNFYEETKLWRKELALAGYEVNDHWNPPVALYVASACGEVVVLVDSKEFQIKPLYEGRSLVFIKFAQTPDEVMREVNGILREL